MEIFLTKNSFLCIINKYSYNDGKNSFLHLQIFPGLNANDGVQVVTNTLPSPVIARCLRMFPMTWNYSACLRM